VYGSDGKLLLEGKTNEQGNFDFQIPVKSSLKVVLEAGMGHRAEWTIPAEEIEGSVTETIQAATQVQDAAKEDRKESERSTEGVSTQEIETAVEKVLDKKLQPILRMLAASQQKNPSLSDILGGLGYILGLVGLAAYVHYRKKTRQKEGGVHPTETA
jgi:nickel transport protein